MSPETSEDASTSTCLSVSFRRRQLSRGPAAPPRPRITTPSSASPPPSRAPSSKRDVAARTVDARATLRLTVLGQVYQSGPDPHGVKCAGHETYADWCPNAHKGDPSRAVEACRLPIFGQVQGGIDGAPESQPDEGGET